VFLRTPTGALACAAALMLPASPAIGQQHSYTPADIENGSRLYQSSCAGCHAPTGDGVPGVDLVRGQFRRATTDSELVVIIRQGIPGTTMPPSSFSGAEADTIVAFLRNMATARSRGGAATAAVRGDAARGKMLFEGKGECRSCHRVNGVGPRVAPDLSEVGAVRSAAEIEQKLIDPNAVVRPGNRYVELVTNDGTRISGRLLNQDTFSIQLIDTNERLLSVSKSNLRDQRFIKTSTMPSFRDKLSAAEVSDLVSYMFSLKGSRP
jgi:putative heme-binding domain-containing protein